LRLPLSTAASQSVFEVVQAIDRIACTAIGV
jgi:hypothetical protein